MQPIAERLAHSMEGERTVAWPERPGRASKLFAAHGHFAWHPPFMQLTALRSHAVGSVLPRNVGNAHLCASTVLLCQLTGVLPPCCAGDGRAVAQGLR